MKIKFLITILFVLLVSFLLFSNNLQAADLGEDSRAAGSPATLQNPIPSAPDIPTLIGKIINAALGIMGSLALVMFIYGGFTWMTAAGNAERVTKGKQIIVWAAVGIVVIFASYSVVNFVIKSLTSTT